MNAGRWPSNVILSHVPTETGEDACANGCVPGCPAAELDTQSEGTRAAKPSAGNRGGRGQVGAVYDYGGKTLTPTTGEGYTDSGGASRFFNTFRYGYPGSTASKDDAMTADLPRHVWCGDATSVMRTLPDNSVDSIVTDPPYGLAEHKPDIIVKAMTAWCSGDRDHVPDGKGFMGRKWDAFVPPPAVWDECMRVLKPGGHLLCFAGTRTVDLMGLSIRLAGFEMRDSVTWLYSQGFPKSLDVGKAIDKRGARSADAVTLLKTELRAAFEASGMTLAELNERCGFEASGYLRTSSTWATLFPTPDKWTRMREVIGGDDQLGARFRAAEREVIGERTRAATGRAHQGEGGYAFGEEFADTAPATDAARQWQGWGTALKPASEPVIRAQKPFSVVPSGGLVSIVHHSLGGLLWLSASPAKRAELSSPSSPHVLPVGTCGSALAAAVSATSPEQSATTATYSSPALASTCSSIVTSWSNTLGALSRSTTTSTTSTVSSTITGLKTLNSLLAPLTSPTTMPNCGCLTGGNSSPATNAGSNSSDEWARWRHTLSASAPANAIEGIALAASVVLAQLAEELSSEQEGASTALPSATTASPDGSSSVAGVSTVSGSTSPAGTPGGTAHSGAPGSPNTAEGRTASEPIIVARKPFPGTVAANVLQYGTGALNVDGCRVGDGHDRTPGGVRQGPMPQPMSWGQEGRERTERATGGRWPANVVLIHSPNCNGECEPNCPVAELDAQSGPLKSGNRKAGEHGLMGYMGADVAPMPEVVGDSGGASRFFATFRYQAKAPTSERPKINGIAHPTVKPLALISWLCRLVTPPGGTVLDPFAGSGTTGEAAQLEGFGFYVIEQDEQYLPHIFHRLTRSLTKIDTDEKMG